MSTHPEAMRRGTWHPHLSSVGQLSYAALFVVALPLLLIAWANRLDDLFALPVAGSLWQGALLATAGSLLMLAATVALRVYGGGWPMSPFPPVRRVTEGPYAIVSDPIYVGACLLAAGLSIAFTSPAGVWIVTPVLALACAAFVSGYEREATDAHFGPRVVPPLLRLPSTADARAEAADRISIYFLVFLPWLLAYEGVNLLGVPEDALHLGSRWDAAIPVIGWTEPIYFLAYPMLLALPLVIRTKRELRSLAIQGWVAIISITMIYLVFPTFIDSKPVPDGTVFAPMLAWERAFDGHSTGFPAFHVVWIVIAAAAYSRAFPALRTLWWILAAAISVSCVTTGMHVIVDVVAGFAVAAAIVTSERIWQSVLRASESIAGSWRERDMGAVRLLSHGVYAAVGGFFGVLIVGWLAGPAEVAAGAAIAIVAITGAGLWAQFVEGSPALLRPYGFYGGLLGGTVAIALAPLAGSDGWLLLGAFAVGTPVVQAWGRVRCLIQGCCHGRPCDESIGIRYTHPRSRVTRLAGLTGTPVHPTQTYSIVWSVLTFLLLGRLWMIGAPLAFIAGAFFILNGLGRFVEEHFRGEPQTAVAGGLHLYQWLAIGCVVAGAALTTVRTASAPPVAAPTPGAWLAGAVVALFAYIAYGVDFPRLNTRFSRLV